MSESHWLDESMSLPGLTDLCLQGFKKAFCDFGDGWVPLHEQRQLWESEEQLKAWLLDQLSRAGKSWDAKFPFVDATLRNGFRLHAVFPPLSDSGILVSLRKLPGWQPSSVSRKSESERRWGISPFWEQLNRIVAQGETLIISGATGSGKTTLLGDLLEKIPAQERVIALEDTAEIQPSHDHFIRMVSRPSNADGFGEVSLRALLKQSLRMRPDRILLGECRGAEVLELLQALNTGHRGTLATLHANSPRDALRRLELLCLLSGGAHLSSSMIRELLSVGVQWIVQVGRQNGRRQILELCRVEGREGDTILMRPWGSAKEPEKRFHGLASIEGSQLDSRGVSS